MGEVAGRWPEGAGHAASAGCTTGGCVCLYRDGDFKGGQVTLGGTVTGITHLSAYGSNDQADSCCSNYSNDAAWYTEANYVGRTVCMHSYTSNRSFSFQDSDEAGSTRKLSSPTSC